MRLNSKNRKPRSRKAFACLCLAGGLLFLGMVFGLSRYSDMQSCEHRMNELIDFVKEQSSAYVQYNETAVAKALVRGTTAMQELDGLTLDWIHGLCAGLVPAELRQVDIPEQVRDSDGEQDAQNDQRNSQLYQSKAAFSAPLRHDRCLLSVPVQKQGNTAPIYPFYILTSPVFPVKHRQRSSAASRPFSIFLRNLPFSAPQRAKKAAGADFGSLSVI